MPARFAHSADRNMYFSVTVGYGSYRSIWFAIARPEILMKVRNSPVNEFFLAKGLMPVSDELVFDFDCGMPGPDIEIPSARKEFLRCEHGCIPN